jgi:hypothetical protein
MKHMMTTILAFVCLGIGLTLGYTGKEIYEKQRPKAKKQESAWIKELRTYQDDDFLHSYEGIKSNLTSAEQFLGDRLVSCIDQKQTQSSQLAELQERVEDQQERMGDASFIEKFLGQEPEPQSGIEGQFVPQYNRETQSPVPIQVSDARYAQLFPDQQLQHPEEDLFGFVAEPVDDVQAFLDRRVCNNPALTALTPSRRQRSKFFNTLRASVFEGNVAVDSPQAERGEIRGRVEFQSPRHRGQDAIYIQQGPLVMETRLVDPRSASVWRYSSCQPSVVLLNDRCSWSDQYIYEYKDFYYLAAEDMLVANVYCKKQNGQQWKRMGTLQFEQISG